jgi:glycerol-3-phosphate dehydrogenase
MALGAADFLARRLPLALLDRQAAQSAAPWVLSALAESLGWDERRRAAEREEVALWTAPCP